MKRRAAFRLAATIGVYCAAMAVAVVVAADCKVFEMATPDPATLKLPDGEHVIGSVATPGGKIEARVVVKGKDISNNQLYLAGKAMRSSAQSQVPNDIRECLGIKKTALLEATGWLTSAAGALRDLIETPVEARDTRCTYKCSCNQNTCCCIAFCGAGTGVGCAGY
jgi:hypothetical protein